MTHNERERVAWDESTGSYRWGRWVVEVARGEVVARFWVWTT